MTKRVWEPSYGRADPLINYEWRFLTGDMNWIDYGGIWYRWMPDYSGCLLITFENKEEWGDGATGYYAQVRMVSLIVPDKVLADAFRCCGIDENTFSDLDQNQRMLTVVDCLNSHGTYAPLDSFEGTHPVRVRAEARQAANDYFDDGESLAASLSRPVNKIGSTGYDFMRGDSLAGLRTSDSPEADLMRRMYAACGGQTLGGVLDEAAYTKEDR